MTDPEDEVRRRLAAARHTDPIPDDVAARLSERLAELSLPRVDDELAAVRRRRAATLLVAAAAVLVGGIGVGTMLGPSGGGGDAGTAETAADAGAAMDSTATLSENGSGADADESAAAEEQDAPEDGFPAGPTITDRYVLPRGADGPVRLRQQKLANDVRRIARQVDRVDLAGARNGAAELTVPPPAVGCEPAAYGEGTLVPARYAGEMVVLALRPPIGGTRVADLLQCGSAEPVKSLTVPVD